MTYEEALRYVSSLAPKGWRLGLDRMEEFARRAQLLDQAPRFVHIAGTNGKGSVTAFTESILRAAGHRTGAFFSPFVYDPRERVQANGEMISESDFASIVAALAPIGEAMEDSPFQGPTEFELKTAVGLRYWQGRADWVALEVGLGGRLDATNIVTPAVSAIVSIGLDHQKILGDTVEAIAAEKGGIVKPGVPVVIGEMDLGPREVLVRIASERDSPAHLYGSDFSAHATGLRTADLKTSKRELRGVELGLAGERQPHNAALALQALETAGALDGVPEEAIRQGIAEAYCPGRYEKRGRFILDGAHNPQAAEVLVESLRADGIERVPIVTSMVNGHESEPFYAALASVATQAFIAPISSARAQPPERVLESAQRAGMQAQAFGTVEEAVLAAEQATPDGPILVTGSFYFVGEVGNWLKTCRGLRFGTRPRGRHP